jgi:hypothetical protein
MAIDPSIYGQQVQPKFNTPFEVLGQLGVLQRQRQEAASAQALEQERQQKMADDAKKQKEADTFNAIIGNPAITRDSLLEQIRTKAPEHYLGALKSFQDLDKSAADYDKLKADAADANAKAQEGMQKVIGTVANGVAAHNYAPAAFEAGLKELEQRFPAFAPTAQNYRQLALQNGPEWIKEHVDGLRSMADRSTAAKLPGEAAQSAITTQVAAGTVGGLTPEQQKQEADRQAQLKQGQQRIGLEAQRVGIEKANAAEKNAPPDITSSVNTTQSGNKYLDLSVFQTPKAREDARKQADAAGIIAVDKDTAAGLKAADTARSNFNSMLAQVKGKLPTDPTGRVITGPKNLLEKYFQNDADLAAFGSWRQAAIQGVQSLAEKGMGLRLNQVEINNMIDALPKLTDTWDTAQQKVKNFGTMLDNKEKNALSRDRSAATSPSSSDGRIYYDSNGKPIQR